MGWKDAPVKGAKKNKWEDAQVLGAQTPTQVETPIEVQPTYSDVLAAPAELFKRGVQASQGTRKFGKNPLAGAGFISQSILQAGLTPFSLADVAARRAGFGKVADVFGAVPKFISSATEPVGELIGSTLGAGLPEYKRKEAEEAFGGLVGTSAAIYGTPPVMSKAFKGVVGAPKATQEAAGKTSRLIAAKAHQPPFVAAKGLEQFDRQISTVVRENLPPSRKGVQKTVNILNQLDNTAQPLRNQATQSGTKIDFEAFKQALENEKSKYINDADFAEKSGALDNMISRVEAVASQYPNSEVPLNAAWRFKQTLQNMVGGKYDEVAGYSKEAAKTSAHLLLDDVVSKVPELREIGLRQRDLIEAQLMQSRRIAALEKSKPWGRGARAALTGSGVGIFSRDPTLAIAVGAAEYLSESPKLQHTTSVALDRLSKLGKGKENPYSGYTATPFPPRAGTAPRGGFVPPGGFTPPTPTYGPGAPPFTAPPVSTAAPKSIKDIFPNYPGNKTIELPRDILPIQFKSSGEAISYGKSATPGQIAQLQTLRETAVSQSQLPGEFDLRQQYGQQGAFYREALESIPKSTEEVMTPTTPELLAQYRKYVSAEIAAGREPKPLSEWKREL